MKKSLTRTIAATFILAAYVPSLLAERAEQLVRTWDFSRDSIHWNSVTIPHDWAIYGPFDRSVDLQTVAIEQNGETEKTEKTARSGGLPFIGKGYYRTTFTLPDNPEESTTLIFDGAMSRANVYVNGKKVGYWPYGYNSFYLNLDGVAHAGENTLEVSLENKPESSRWYPGAGLYRNVHLLRTSRVHVPVWGTYITTPVITDDSADVKIVTSVEGARKGERVTVATTILDPAGNIVASGSVNPADVSPLFNVAQNLKVPHPQLWHTDIPNLYTARTEISVDGKVVDTYDSRFGIRSVSFVPDEGFFLNGQHTMFRGVCLHHDLGPLGAAVNRSAIRHQLEMLKDMGINAVRTSHNMPAPELVELCDEMGIMLMVEPFDDWGFRPKCQNGYGSLFADWAEKDVTNMVRHYRNSPSVVIWSIGNEVPSQWGPDGVEELNFLQDIVHREDPTRPVIVCNDQFDAVVSNGFGAASDLVGFNYKPNRYPEAYGKLPQKLILGSETASTVSSRGKYFFPVEYGQGVTRPGNHCSSYDVECCTWSNIPDDDFYADEEYNYNMGQFVWTGFDYLGEPYPYDTDAWPSHSSYFGIIDLASIPKDRYYLYRSKWNRKDSTLHILPHWNWEGREGEITPVFIYTDAPKAELFLNGKSLGVREKNDSTRMNRYRLMWNDVRYEPGELTAVAYDLKGNETGRKTIRTAGKPDHFVLTSSRDFIEPTGDDLAYITVRVADKDGNIVPDDEREVKFEVTGDGHFRATANGDPTSLRAFHKPEMDLFSGACTVIVESNAGNVGEAVLKVSSKGLPAASFRIPVRSSK